MSFIDSLGESKKMIGLSVLLLIICCFGLYLAKNGTISTNNISNDDTVETTKAYSGAEDVLEEGVNYKALIKTNYGDITIDLYEDDMPIAVNNFVFLAKNGFYDGLIFHRVVKNFVIQGGDPTGTGAGGPGYKFKDEKNTKSYTKYSVGMANSGANTNGSQFYIVSGNISSANLSALDNGGYVLFGEVIDGFDVVDTIEDVEVGSGDRPLKDVIMEKVTILEY